ncbi:DUF1851 domain-containing protein [Burkholderia sp. Ac-20365]|nr:DUF1851 domain-containing protein [Burkholderia sp. Ac-20365]
MYEPGTGQALEIPCDIESFHDKELVGYRDAVLAEPFFLQWVESGGHQPQYTQCVGYKRSLFLGGEDTLANLEVIDLDVY